MPKLALRSGMTIMAAVLATSSPVQAQPEEEQQRRAQRTVEEEIIVTGSRRREEAVQTIPLSVTSLSDRALERHNIVRVEDVDDIVPNLIMTETARVNNARITIRGIGGGSTTQVFSSGVGLYVDGIYVPNSIGPYTSTFEIERLEVLRGPQGTLFGKNTTGGLVNIVTKRPGPETEASATVGAGRFNEFRGRFMLNQPLTDTLYARAAVGYHTDSGYTKELNSGDGYSDNQNRSYRVALRWLPSNAWTTDLTGTYIFEPRRATGGQCVFRGNTVNNSTRHESGGGGEFGGSIEEACTLSENAGDRRFYSDVAGFGRINIHAVTAAAQWDSLGPAWGFENVTARFSTGYRSTHQEYRIDNDYSNADYNVRMTQPNGGGTTAHGESFEMLLDTVSMNGRLDTLVGYYFFRDRVTVDGGNCIDVYKSVRGTGETRECYQPGYTTFSTIPFNVTGAGPSPYSQAQTPHSRPSHGLFAHAQYQVTPRLTWEIGGRYTRETLRMESIDWVSTRTPAGFKHYINDETVELYVKGNESWSAFTPMTSLTYDLQSAGPLTAGIVYASVSTGFLSGGINNELDVDIFQDHAIFDPEHVTTYEVGLKSTWLDNRLRANLSVFYTDYRDKQEEITIDNTAGLFPGDPNLSVFDNAAKLEIRGFELETSFNVTDSIVLDINVAYLDNQYKDFPTFDFVEGTVIDQSDLVVDDFSPPWTGNAAAEHTLNFEGGSRVRTRIGVYAQDPYRTNQTSNVHSRPGGVCYRPGYDKWDARVTWENVNRDMEVSFWGTNLSDREIFRTCGVSGANGYQTFVLEPPRRYGIQLSKHW
jgi:iron complex outermembrane recepter protein